MRFVCRYVPVLALALLYFPQFVLAAQNSGSYFGEVDSLFIRFKGFIDSILIPLVFTVALLVFLYGMFKYFIAEGGNETSRETGKKLILWSIVGFVLMVSIWGIVNMLAKGLFGNPTAPTIPGTPTLQGGGGGAQSRGGGGAPPLLDFGRSGPQ